MPNEHILVVDDEEDLRELLSYNLNKEGYQVHSVGTGEEALSYAEKKLPDLIVLDLMLPNVDGLEVCRRLKSNEETRGITIIMLTAKTEESDVVVGLELGADDYITKPFSPRVLVARIRAVVRRRQTEVRDESNTIKIHELIIDPLRHEVRLGGESMDLTYTEFALLHFLSRKPGRAFTRNQIVDAIKGADYPVTDRSVDVQVAGLRKKMGHHSDYIETVRGVGYRFKE